MNDYLTLAEVMEKTSLTEKQLLRGEIEQRYWFYHIKARIWSKVPRGTVIDLYNGEESVTTDIYIEENGKWFIQKITECDPKGDPINKITKMKISISDLHMRSRDIESILIPTSTSEQKSTESLTDDNHPLMPEELRICNEAWRALYKDKTPDHGKQIRKKHIEEWIKENHPNLPNNTLERLSTVINPHKKGGATPTK